jgi:hypothetical protein
MLRAKDFAAVAALLSVTTTVKFAKPAAVGVPLICPVAEFSDSPAGKAPVLMDQV